MNHAIVNGGHDLRRPERTDDIDTGALRRELERSVRGEVRFDAGYRAIYSNDSSNYRQQAIGVVVPADQEDVVTAMAVCRAHDAPVLPRGCGTSLSGETVNHAVVIDVSRNLRAIKEIDREQRFAIVEPGVIHDQLTAITEPQMNLTFAPDTSTHAWATFGGMIGNNSCGVHSVMGGRTSDNIHELEIVTYDGERLRVGETSDAELERIAGGGGRRGDLYRRMRALRDRYAEQIRAGYPPIPRRVSGYNLDDLLPEKGFHVARALTGSEGTLAMVLEAKVRLLYSPPARALLVTGYPEHAAAAEDVPALLEAGAIGLEGIDHKLLWDIGQHKDHPDAVALLPAGDAFLLTEFGGESREEAEDKARKALKAIGRSRDEDSVSVVSDPGEQEMLWEVRESGLGATSYVPMERDHWPGWEDAAVPPAKVAPYLRDFDRLLEQHGYRASLYGHYGDGCIHCRINFDLRTDGGIRDWRRFLDEAADLVVSYGGSLSGEHGDGQARAELLEKMYGAELVKAMEQFKAIWDPGNRMNPHKVVDPYPIVSNLKLGAGYRPAQPRDLHFSYPEDGGSFAHAALRCVGAGACRETQSGTMCPSYTVTLDEQHTTRGRARVLNEMLLGDTITDGFRSDDVHEALDLCLSCKGCKGDCPVHVDMATYKAEFLSKYYKRRLRPRAAYSMGLIMLHARLASRAPRLANALFRAPGLGGLLKRAGGIAPEREMPPFAHETFQAWFERRGAVNPRGRPVVLFPDTFNQFLHPEPLKATVEVLEAAGFRVVLPEQPVCCGRPLYDYGMLPTARRFLERLVAVLGPHARAGALVVGVEPSCVAVFRDELVSLLPHDEDAKRLSLQTLTLAEFLQQEAPDWEVPPLRRRALVHGHCHQKAVMGMSAEQQLYERMGLDAELLDAGCCGLAGSFGFEAEHHDISVAIAEQRLLPIVRDAPEDTLLIADGFSCKTQIEQLSERRALHTAQVIKMAIDHGPEGVAGPRPERQYPDVELNGRRRAGAGLAVRA
jgi:FAD/FMN-containing dehydrogenase/Fe-S oxidoreductase